MICDIWFIEVMNVCSNLCFSIMCYCICFEIVAWMLFPWNNKLQKETYVDTISKFLYKKFSRTQFRKHWWKFFENTPNKGFFEKVSQLCIFSKNPFSRKLHFEIISKTVVLCVCEKCSSLVIFSKTQHNYIFFRECSISVFAKYLANQYSR